MQVKRKKYEESATDLIESEEPQIGQNSLVKRRLLSDDEWSTYGLPI